MREIIEKYLVNESQYPIFGKEKSKQYLIFRQQVFSAKNDSTLTKLMKKFESAHRSGKLRYHEMLDLVSKVDEKKLMMSKKGRL